MATPMEQITKQIIELHSGQLFVNTVPVSHESSPCPTSRPRIPRVTLSKRFVLRWHAWLGNCSLAAAASEPNSLRCLA